jgi:4-aminobutyrate aminotransferase-like enzyme
VRRLELGKHRDSTDLFSAVLSTDAIVSAEPFSLPSASSSSYGGNPLASAAALVTIQTIVEDGLVDNSARVGRLLLDGLRDIAARRRSIANVRGRGLLIGFDLVQPAASPAAVSAAARPALMAKAGCVSFFKECLSHGVILMGYTPRVRIHPPLILSAAEATRALSVIDAALQKADREC